jgi:cell division protein FtsI/penicillin-binding protein 2
MFRRRVRILAILFALGYLVALGRLGQLQLLQGPALRERGERKIHRLKQVSPRRGSLLDRNGRVVAEDAPTFDLYFVPGRSAGRGRTELVLEGLPLARAEAILQSEPQQRAFETELAARHILEQSALGERLAKLAERPAREVVDGLLAATLEAVEDPAPGSLYRPRKVLEDVGAACYLAVLAERRMHGEDSLLFPVEPRLGWKRLYPLGEAAAHITGYVGPLNAREYEQLRGRWGPDGERIEGMGSIPGFFVPTESEAYIMRLYESSRNGRTLRAAGYLENDTVGRTGLERQYNTLLRGSHGLRHERLTRPEPGGPRVWTMVREEAAVEAGRDITLSLDIGFQQRVYEILRNATAKLLREEPLRESEGQNGGTRTNRGLPYPAAGIMMRVNTGEIEALVSLPSFDPGQINERYLEYRAPESQKPFLNRVIAENYPPGSTFKTILATAALNEGVITPETIFTCDGFIRLGGHDFICMRRFAHGPINVLDALMVSCNVFFYRTAETLGRERFANYVTDFGFGSPTGIDLPGERPGQLPAGARSGIGWSTGATYHLAIGQGIAVTPVQLAVAVAAIANGGKVVRPHLWRPADPEMRARLNEPERRLPLREEAMEVVRRGMWKVVNDEQYGSGRRGRIAQLEFAGKTGSADWKKGAPTHAVFVSFAPAENPQVALVVLVEQGNFGGRTCAPIAREIYRAFFDLPETEGVG